MVMVVILVILVMMVVRYSAEREASIASAKPRNFT